MGHGAALLGSDYLLAFWDYEGGHESSYRRLGKVKNNGRSHPFCNAVSHWKHCGPVMLRGVKRPWFGGECTVDPDAEVVIYRRDGVRANVMAGSLIWDHCGADHDIFAYIEL